jgi:hypothetical protein
MYAAKKRKKRLQSSHLFHILHKNKIVFSTYNNHCHIIRDIVKKIIYFPLFIPFIEDVSGRRS